jgi:hypothetical protein
VVFCLGCLLSQIITPLILIRITGFECFIGGKLVLQVGSLPTSFLMSLGIVARFLLLVKIIKYWKLKAEKVRFKIEYFIVGLPLLLVNDRAKEIFSHGEELTGINITIWVYLPLEKN